MKFYKIVNKKYLRTDLKKALKELENKSKNENFTYEIIETRVERSEGFLRRFFEKDVFLKLKVPDVKRNELFGKLLELRNKRELLYRKEGGAELTDSEQEALDEFMKQREERRNSLSTRHVNIDEDLIVNQVKEKVMSQMNIDKQIKVMEKQERENLKKKLETKAKKEQERLLREKEKEFEELKRIMRQEKEEALKNQMKSIAKKEREKLLEKRKTEDEGKWAELKKEEKNWGIIEHYLLQRGVMDSVVSKIRKDIGNLELPTPLLKQKVNEYIRKKIKEAKKKFEETHRTMYFGATGVGKTSTIVKLTHKEDIKNTLILSADNVRMGSKEELMSYKKVFGLNAGTLDLDEEKIDFEGFNEYDYIHLDLPGTNPKNLTRLKRVEQQIKGFEIETRALVVCATQKNSDLIRTIECYKDMSIDYVIVTKMDETNEPGSIINIALETGMPIAYITNGQNVKAFIQEFDKNTFLEYFWKEFETTEKGIFERERKTG